MNPPPSRVGDISMFFEAARAAAVTAIATMLRLLPTSISKLQSRKWVLSGLWLLLVFIFFAVTTPHLRQDSDLDFSILGASANSTNSTGSHLSLYDYYSSLTHTNDKAEPNLIEYGTSANVNTSNKVAVIVETRKSGGIVPIVLQFSAVLGPEWPVIIYTSAENFGSFGTSAALVRHQRSGRIVIRSLAENVTFPSWDSVSEFLTTPWLWNDLAPAEHILLFQTDSILCGNSVRKVEDFFEYDFIGAPIDKRYGKGYNGGLSLRKRSTTLRILDEWKFKGPKAEDQWYFEKLSKLEQREREQGVQGGVKLPTMEIARTFAVESIDYPHPLGLHQPTRFIKDHILSLDDWCPEYRLARTERMV